MNTVQTTSNDISPNSVTLKYRQMSNFVIEIPYVSM